MAEYVFVDGPLAGEALNSGDPHASGDLLLVEVVDVGQHPDCVPQHDYYVESAATRDAPGRLRHSAGPAARMGDT